MARSEHSPSSRSVLTGNSFGIFFGQLGEGVAEYSGKLQQEISLLMDVSATVVL
jgi:hypothetical protein